MKTKNINYLSRHAKYIDHRLARIKNFILPEDTASVIFFLTGKTFELVNFSDNEKTPIIELKRLIENWNILKYGDIVGYIYQTLQNKKSLKNKGQFFTPDDIVKYMSAYTLSFFNKEDDIRILDPSCGSGQFLLYVYSMMLKRYPGAGEKIIKENIFGIDIDPIAAHIARYNLASVSGCSLDDVQIRCADFLRKENKEKLFPEKSFDIIIGNPPWGGSLDIYEKRYIKNNYRSSASGVNTFSLFIERGYDFLADDGIIAYLIPEAYLNIKAHMCSRKMMIEKTSILRLTMWGERFKNVFAPSVSFFAALKSGAERSNVVQVTRGGANENLAVMVPQAAFLKTPEHIFNINYTKKCVNIIENMEEQKNLSLKDNAKFYLGIVTGDNERFISGTHSDEFPDPIVIGRDVEPFRVGFSGHHFKYDPDALQQSAPQNLYLAPDKILYKFIGRRLTFAIDRDGFYSLNNVNGFIPDKNFLDVINSESLAAVLNSSLMQYYYEKNFFTLKVLRGNLERLPIKNITKENQKRLKEIVSFIHGSGCEGSAFERCKENMDDIIYSEYGISDKMAYSIN